MEAMAQKRGSRKDPAAVRLGRKGGKARLSTMTAEERSRAARRAVQARWNLPEERHNRALGLLRKHKHDVGECTDGNNIEVDGKTYRVMGVYRLAERLYPEEWASMEARFLKGLKRRRS